jgi:hypothetical protein
MRAPNSMCSAFSGVVCRSVVRSDIGTLSIKDELQGNAVPSMAAMAHAMGPRAQRVVTPWCCPRCPLYLRDSPAENSKRVCSFGGRGTCKVCRPRLSPAGCRLKWLNHRRLSVLLPERSGLLNRVQPTSCAFGEPVSRLGLAGFSPDKVADSICGVQVMVQCGFIRLTSPHS